MEFCREEALALQLSFLIGKADNLISRQDAPGIMQKKLELL